MNIWILSALICMALYKPFAFFGILVGLGFCYLMTDKTGKDNMIMKLKTWNWWDISK